MHVHVTLEWPQVRTIHVIVFEPVRDDLHRKSILSTNSCRVTAVVGTFIIFAPEPFTRLKPQGAKFKHELRS